MTKGGLLPRALSLPKLCTFQEICVRWMITVLLSTSLNLSQAFSSMELAISDFVLEYRLLH